MSSTDNRGPAVIALTSVFTILSIAVTGVRLLVRYQQRQFGLDDWTIAGAILFSFIAWPFTILAVQNGYGQHISQLPHQEAVNASKWMFLVQICVFLTLPLTKMSICFFILRIKNSGWLKWFLWTLMALLVVTNVLPLIVLCIQCQPVYAWWDRAAGKCWNPSLFNAAVWVGVATNIFADFACTCLPVVVLWNVKIKRKLKYLITALMGLGLLATAAGGVRAYVSAQATGSADSTYDPSLIREWAVIEQNLAILGANMALARYVWLYFWPKPDPSRASTNVRSSIPLSRRNKYASIQERSLTNSGSMEGLKQLESESGGIRATTEIDIRRTAPTSRSESPVDIYHKI